MGTYDDGGGIEPVVAGFGIGDQDGAVEEVGVWDV